MAEITVAIKVTAKSGYDTTTIAKVDTCEVASDEKFTELTSKSLKSITREVERIIEDSHEKVEAQLANKRKALAKEEVENETEETINE